MANLFLLIFALVSVSVLIARFLDDIWLHDYERRQLKARFESWWYSVYEYDRMKFALAVTQVFNRYADRFFGEKFFSKKAFFRCSVIATGLLISSMSFTGILNDTVMGIAPWTTYKESCKAVSDYADYIDQSGLTKNGILDRPNVTFSAITATNHNTGTNHISEDPASPAFISVMIVHDMETNEDVVHGNFWVGYYFSGGPGGDTNNPELSTAQVWSNNVTSIRKGVEKYNTTGNVVTYTVAYFTLLIIANIVICFGSLVLCRMILRDICVVGRIGSTVHLLISNFFCLTIASSIFLFLLLFLSIPLFWLLLPFAGQVAQYSMFIFAISTLALSFSAWRLNCIPLDTITVITFLPFFFSFFVTLFSLVAMLCRKQFHSLTSEILIRCADKNPLYVIPGIFAAVTSIVVIIVRLFHGSYQ